MGKMIRSLTSLSCSRGDKTLKLSKKHSIFPAFDFLILKALSTLKMISNSLKTNLCFMHQMVMILTLPVALVNTK